jgi:hypothetical protein
MRGSIPLLSLLFFNALKGTIVLFDKLSSELIKEQLIARFVYTIGFKAINACLKAQPYLKENKPLPLIDGYIDETILNNATTAKRQWACLQDFAATKGYRIDNIEAVAEAFIKGTGKPTEKTNDHITSLRASVSGMSETALKAQANKQRLTDIAKKEEEVNSIITEFADIKEYANIWYIESDLGDVQPNSVDIEDFLSDEWVHETYPKIVKTQCAFWNKYNNWDDAELVLIDADNQLIKE